MHANKPIDLAKVRGARNEEMGYVKDMGVYKYVYRDRAREEAGGKAPIRVRWVDSDKGERFRSRLCAMEIRRTAESAWFAGTPPLESLRVLAAVLAAQKKGGAGLSR